MKKVSIFLFLYKKIKWNKKNIFFQSLHKYSQAFVDFGAVQHILYFIYLSGGVGTSVKMSSFYIYFILPAHQAAQYVCIEKKSQ